MKLKSITADTNQGPLLNINEDNFHQNIEEGLYMVMDGFGGAGIGDVATKKLQENINHFFTNITADINATLPFFYSAKYLLESNALINSMLSSNEKLYSENMTKEYSQRAGASAVLISTSDTILNIINVGNCRAYLIRESSIHKIFSEDSFHLLSSDTNKSHLKSIPLNAFGLYPDLSYQVKEVRFQEGDKFIFMTDGAYSNIREEEIKNQFINENVSSKKRIEKVFELVNKRGNLDNQTCMLLEF